MNNTLSKEYLLNKHNDTFPNEMGMPLATVIYSAALNAMGEYAKQEIFEFAKFVDDNHFRRNRASNMWFDNNFQFLTEDQLHEQYLLHKQNKEQ